MLYNDFLRDLNDYVFGSVAPLKAIVYVCDAKGNKVAVDLIEIDTEGDVLIHFTG